MRRVSAVIRTFLFLVALVPLVAQPAFVLAQDAVDTAASTAADAPAGESSEPGATPEVEEGSDDQPAESTSAEAPVELSGAKVAWMLTSSALVLMMTAPGLALFYGGLVRKKNILGIMMQCMFLMGLMTVVWGIVGYSFAFGGENPFVGNFDYVLMKGVIADGVMTDAEWANESIFFVFQGMFFIITPALICGAFAERMKFSSMCVFSVLWGLLVYCPVCHWVWSSKGWLCEANKDALYPALDFAGGTVVHISSGVSALLCSLLIGKRIGFPQEPMPPHNLTYTCIGAALLCLASMQAAQSMPMHQRSTLSWQLICVLQRECLAGRLSNGCDTANPAFWVRAPVQLQAWFVSLLQAVPARQHRRSRWG